MIEPKLLKGFRDFLPEAELKKLELQKKLEDIFRSMGFAPIDTPALEYAGVLFGKGGGETDKQGYRFNDAGGREVALRFDLTVPFARFAALHLSELPMPFKRYHIAKVWRGENTQKGRYREFTQCDFDIIGTESAAADFEILLIMQKALRALTGGARFTIRVNHRGLFNKFLAKIGAEEMSAAILRTVDKLSKTSEDSVNEALSDLLGKERAAAILEYIKPQASWDAAQKSMTSLAGGDCPEAARLSELRSYMAETGIAASFELDPSIARGLDYYTGVVFESFIDDCAGIGSVCSGGRYDNLAELYTKERLSGAGASVGLDRLIAAMDELGHFSKTASYAKTAIICVKPENHGRYQAAAEKLRANGISCDVFLEPEKLSRQYQSAEKKGIPFALIEEAEGLWTLRELAGRTDKKALPLEKITAMLTALEQRLVKN